MFWPVIKYAVRVLNRSLWFQSDFVLLFHISRHQVCNGQMIFKRGHLVLAIIYIDGFIFWLLLWCEEITYRTNESGNGTYKMWLVIKFSIDCLCLSRNLSMDLGKVALILICMCDLLIKIISRLIYIECIISVVIKYS